MRETKLGLFDLPEPEPKPAATRPQRGRNRETWALTAIADVTIIDAVAVTEAAARAQADGLVVGFEPEPVADDPAGTDADAAPRHGGSGSPALADLAP